ncbi:MAG: hypothetical protein ACOC0K_00750 [bacterium]
MAFPRVKMVTSIKQRCKDFRSSSRSPLEIQDGAQTGLTLVKSAILLYSQTSSYTITTGKNTSMGFQIYFWVFTLLMFVSYADLFGSNPRLYDVLDFPVSLAALTGLYGYAYRKRIGEQRIWQLFFLFLIGWDLFYASISLPPAGQSPMEYNITLFLACLMIAPVYMALFFYAFRSPELWGSEQQK